MAKTLASQARNGGSIPLARSWGSDAAVVAAGGLPGLRRAAVRARGRGADLAGPGEAALARVERAVLGTAAAPGADLGDRGRLARARLGGGAPGGGRAAALAAPAEG